MVSTPASTPACDGATKGAPLYRSISPRIIVTIIIHLVVIRYSKIHKTHALLLGAESILLRSIIILV
jgi:hypothetical protein